MSGATVVAECVFCKKTRKIRAGEIPEGDVPMCKECGGPMVAKEAKRDGRRSQDR